MRKRLPLPIPVRRAVPKPKATHKRQNAAQLGCVTAEQAALGLHRLADTLVARAHGRLLTFAVTIEYVHDDGTRIADDVVGMVYDEMLEGIR